MKNESTDNETGEDGYPCSLGCKQVKVHHQEFPCNVPLHVDIAKVCQRLGMIALKLQAALQPHRKTSELDDMHLMNVTSVLKDVNTN